MAVGTKTASRNGAAPNGAAPMMPAQVDARGMGQNPALPSNLVSRIQDTNVTLIQCRELLEAIHSRMSGSSCQSKDAVGPAAVNLLGQVADAEYHANDILAQLRELASAIGA